MVGAPTQVGVRAFLPRRVYRLGDFEMLDTVFRTAACGRCGDLAGTRSLLARYLLAGVAAGTLLAAPMLGTAHAADVATKAPAAAAPAEE